MEGGTEGGGIHLLSNAESTSTERKTERLERGKKSEVKNCEVSYYSRGGSCLWNHSQIGTTRSI